jgi:hypothetical protein
MTPTFVTPYKQKSISGFVLGKFLALPHSANQKANQVNRATPGCPNTANKVPLQGGSGGFAALNLEFCHLKLRN